MQVRVGCQPFSTKKIFFQLRPNSDSFVFWFRIYVPKCSIRSLRVTLGRLKYHYQIWGPYILHVILSFRISPYFLWGVPILIIFTIKKELGLYLHVPGDSGPKTDFDRFGWHPRYGGTWSYDQAGFKFTTRFYSIATSWTELGSNHNLMGMRL